MESSGTGVRSPLVKPTRHPGCEFFTLPVGQARHSPTLPIRGSGDTMAPELTRPDLPNKSTTTSDTGAIDSSSGAIVLSVACGSTIATVSPSPRAVTITGPASESQFVAFTGAPVFSLTARVVESDSPRLRSPHAATESSRKASRQDLSRANRGGMQVICPSMAGCARPSSPRAG